MPRLLGAGGRELFVPPVDGTVVPAHRTRSMVNRANRVGGVDRSRQLSPIQRLTAMAGQMAPGASAGGIASPVLATLQRMLGGAVSMGQGASPFAGLMQVVQGVAARSPVDMLAGGMNAFSGIVDALAARQEGMGAFGGYPAQAAATPSAATPSAGGGKPGNFSATFGDIHIHGGTGASARDLSKEFGRQAQTAFRMAFSDGAI